MAKIRISAWGLLLALISVALLLACGGGGGGSTTRTLGGVTTLTISDPAPCAGPAGPYSHIYVTISDVQASTNATAPAGDSSFVHLIPSLSSAPVQVDLLGQPNSQCFLSTLGTLSSVPAGTYQQLRVILAADGAVIASNHCGNFANCVVLNDGSVHQLVLSAETTEGIQISSTQLSGGSFTPATAQDETLDINFDTCDSIVPLPKGKFRFKPALTAGVATNSSTIMGSVVDGSNLPVTSGTILVALEQADANGVDRVVLQAVADASGNFVLCPVLPGTYDLVVSALSSSAEPFAATVTFGVPAGTNVGKIPVLPSGANSSALLTGLVTTTSNLGLATSADVAISALQQVNTNGLTGVTIPLVGVDSSTLVVATSTTDPTCPLNAGCIAFVLPVAAANPNVGTFSSSGTTYAQGTGSPNYSVDALAFTPLSGAVPSCVPSREVNTGTAVSAGNSTNAGTLAFANCQ